MYKGLIKIYLISVLITAVVLQSVFMIKCERSAILKSENNWNGCLGWAADLKYLENELQYNYLQKLCLGICLCRVIKRVLKSI